MLDKSYQYFYECMQGMFPRIAVLSRKHWEDEGCPTPDQWFLKTRGLDYETAKKYPNETAWSLAKKEQEKPKPEGQTEKRGRGRPKGSKNKPKRSEPSRRGRPRKR